MFLSLIPISLFFNSLSFVAVLYSMPFKSKKIFKYDDFKTNDILGSIAVTPIKPSLPKTYCSSPPHRIPTKFPEVE